MSNVAINIAAEFLGKKAFKQADTATEKLTKSVKRLAATFGIAFGVRGAALAVKAFAEDDKAARALGQTLNNLGLAYGSSAATVNGYISRLEQQTGVLDDELRPAMDRFLRATLSVTKSQELLNLALDISAGTGKSLTQVSQSLQKAYLGQTQALGRLGVGLSKAELTSASFEEIQQRLAVLFAGQASTAANTYAGEIAKLQVAVNNAKETIGKGFVDALKTASGSNTIDPVIKGIDKIANAFAYLTRETGKFIAITKEAFDFSNGIEFFAPKGGYGNPNKGMGNISMSVSSQDTQRADRAAAAKAAAAQLKASQALTKSTKESLKLSKAKAIFDLQKIQIEAALKGKISAEDEIRLKLMKAIEEENLTNIEKYQKALAVAQEKSKELAAALVAIKDTDTGNPFSKWADYVKTAIELTNTVAQASLQAGLNAGAKLSEALSGARYAAQAAAAADASSSAAAITGAYGAASAAAAKAAAEAAAANTAAIMAANKTATEAITAQSKAQQEALEAQLKAQGEALTAQSKAQLEALQKRLADEAAAYKEAAEAAAAAAQAALLTGANDYTAAGLAKIASDAAAQAAAADAATAAASQAAATATQGATSTPISITVNTGIGDANAIAAELQKILDDAHSRGALVGGLYAD
jgi:hypothetical protein